MVTLMAALHHSRLSPFSSGLPLPSAPLLVLNLATSLEMRGVMGQLEIHPDDMNDYGEALAE
jgi:hypothetical protein